MPRPLRIEFAQAVYHVTSRGDRREPIFQDDKDRLLYIGHALVSHYHLVLCTRQANLSALMRHVNGVYTQRVNRRHGNVGHVFQGRYKVHPGGPRRLPAR